MRRILVRKVDKALAVHQGDRDEALQWVDEVLDRLVKEGALDDRRYAIDKARALVRRGNPTRMVQMKLRAKGVAGPLIDEALAVVREESGDPDTKAAAAYVRKRRMGPYRLADVRRELFDKDLARMARAGFAYGLARGVLELEDADAVEIAELSGSL